MLKDMGSCNIGDTNAGCFLDARGDLQGRPLQLGQVDEDIFGSPIDLGVLQFSCFQDVDGVLPPHKPDVEYVEGLLELFLLLITLVVVEKIAEIS